MAGKTNGEVSDKIIILLHCRETSIYVITNLISVSWCNFGLYPPVCFTVNFGQILISPFSIDYYHPIFLCFQYFIVHLHKNAFISWIIDNNIIKLMGIHGYSSVLYSFWVFLVLRRIPQRFYFHYDDCYYDKLTLRQIYEPQAEKNVSLGYSLFSIG